MQTNADFRVGPADRALALTALHHDMSLYDIFGVLGAGGTLVIPDAARRLDPDHWAELMRRERVTLWNSVPTMMQMLVEHAAGREDVLPQSLRLAFLGGDWIPVTLPKRLQALVPGAQVVSVGGPTETTLWNIWYPVEAVDPTWKSIPYGRAIANTRYYVLNQALEDCPTWVPGELCCAGVGVAQGYWRNDEQTQARFITHPRTGERIYRTGDLGRFLPDGTLEFMGRVDLQIKISGMRIEPGEIEAALSQHPAVQAAVVTAMEDSGGHKRLVAHVVPADASRPATEEVDDLLGSAEQRAAEGIVTDPVARLEFKLKHLNLRHEVADRPAVALPAPPLDDALLDRWVARRSYRKFLGRDDLFRAIRPFPELPARSGPARAALSKVPIRLRRRAIPRASVPVHQTGADREPGRRCVLLSPRPAPAGTAVDKRWLRPAGPRLYQSRHF